MKRHLSSCTAGNSEVYTNESTQLTHGGELTYVSDIQVKAEWKPPKFQSQFPWRMTMLFAKILPHVDGNLVSESHQLLSHRPIYWMWESLSLENSWGKVSDPFIFSWNSIILVIAESIINTTWGYGIISFFLSCGYLLGN